MCPSEPLADRAGMLLSVDSPHLNVESGESGVETKTRFHGLWKSPQASKHPPVDKKVLAL